MAINGLYPAAAGTQQITLDGAAGANATWANFIAGGASSDAAFAAAGYVTVETATGNVRVPVIKAP
jgi:hypothetical protein